MCQSTRAGYARLLACLGLGLASLVSFAAEAAFSVAEALLPGPDLRPFSVQNLRRTSSLGY